MLSIPSWITKKRVMLCALACILFVFVLELSFFSFFHGQIDHIDTVASAPVAIVFGAGITSTGKPSDVLQDRLDVAAKLYQRGSVQRILVSGDNSTTDYDEPSNMMRYLVDQKQIPESDVYRDFAGRRTFDTCVRAKHIWGIDRAILVTQEYHLPRALLLCADAGIQARGVSASLRSYAQMPRYAVREVFAFLQAIVDAYIITPRYISGTLEVDLDPS